MSEYTISLGRGRDHALRQASEQLDRMHESQMRDAVARMLEDDCDLRQVEIFLELAEHQWSTCKPDVMKDLRDRVLVEAFPSG